NVTCAARAATDQASWVADTARAFVAPGVITRFSLTFRRVNFILASGNFLDNVAALAAGPTASYALMADGHVKQWGLSGLPASATTSPQTVPGATLFAQIAAGGEGLPSPHPFACGRTPTGGVSCWGDAGGGRVLGPIVAAGGVSATPVPIPLPLGA